MISDWLHKISFWVIIVFMLGASAGAYGMHVFTKWQIESNISLGAFLHACEKHPGPIYKIDLKP